MADCENAEDNMHPKLKWIHPINSPEGMISILENAVYLLGYVQEYKCGREDYHKNNGSGGKGNKEQIYSYEYDDEYIYGAFYEQYKIDLEYDKVHWWKFKALLKSLKEDTEFVKIKGRAYRKDSLPVRQNS